MKRARFGDGTQISALDTEAGVKNFRGELEQRSQGPVYIPATTYLNQWNRNSRRLAPEAMHRVAATFLGKPVCWPGHWERGGRPIGNVCKSEAVPPEAPDRFQMELEIHDLRVAEQLTWFAPQFSVTWMATPETERRCSSCGADFSDLSSECFHLRGHPDEEGQVVQEIWSDGEGAEVAIEVLPAVPGTRAGEARAQLEIFDELDTLRTERLLRAAKTQEEIKKMGAQLASFLGEKIAERVTEENSEEMVRAGLAEAAGIDGAALAAILDGTDACPTVEVLIGLATALATEEQMMIEAASADGCEYETETEAEIDDSDFSAPPPVQLSATENATESVKNLRAELDELKAENQAMRVQLVRRERKTKLHEYRMAKGGHLVGTEEELLAQYQAAPAAFEAMMQYIPDDPSGQRAWTPAGTPAPQATQLSAAEYDELIASEVAEEWRRLGGAFNADGLPSGLVQRDREKIRPSRVWIDVRNRHGR